MNSEIHERLGIDRWHKAGFTGKGVKVAVFGFEKGAHHNGESIIQEVAPECEIITYDVMRGVDWSWALQDCINKGVDVICCSLRKYSWADEYEKLSKQLYDSGTIMIDSADNESCIIDAWPAKSPYWFAVGAVSKKWNEREAYSCYGPNLSFMGYTMLYARNSEGEMVPISHTSGAVQAPAGMVALLKQTRDMGPQEFEQLLDVSCIDLGEPGRDDKNGKGLFVMPDMETVTLTIGSNEMQVGGETVVVDVAPFIRDGRTFVPLRAVSEALGCLVEWDERRERYI